MGANIASLATSQLITWTLTLLWTFIVPRVLGPTDIGYMVIATSLSSLVTVTFAVATRDFLVREMVSNPSAAGRLLSTAMLSRIVAIPAAFIAAWLYGSLTGLDERGMAVLYLTAAAAGLTLLLDTLLAMFQAFERMQYIAYSNVGVKSLNTLGGVALAVLGFGVVALTSFGVLVAAVALGLALWWARSIVRLGARPAPMLPVLRKARPYWIISLFTMTYIWIDGVILGVLVPPEVVGWYGAATRLFTTMSFVAIIITTASLPRMIAAHAESSERMFVLARQSFEWIVISALPLGIGMACVADDLVSILYGSAYSPSTVPLILLSVGLPMTYANIMANQVFIAAGRPHVIAWVLFAASAVNIVLNLVLIPLTQEQWGNGAVGAALSLLLTEALQMTIGLVLLGRQLLVRSTVRRLAVAAVATAGMAVVLSLTGGAPLLLQVVVGIAVFTVLALSLRLPTAKEYEFVGARLGPLVARFRR